MASSFRAQVEVLGVQPTAAMFREMGRRAYETRPLMVGILGVLEADQRRRVEDAPWAPLTDATIERKIGQGENPDIMRDEARPIKGSPTRERDALYRAITVPGAPGQLKVATRTWATFGVKAGGQQELFYARFVQNVKGTKRRLLAISQGAASTVAGNVATYITYGIGGAAGSAPTAAHWGSSSQLTSRKP